MFNNLKRIDKVSVSDKTYFYININKKPIEYGICFNVNELNNKKEIEEKVLSENQSRLMRFNNSF